MIAPEVIKLTLTVSISPVVAERLVVVQKEKNEAILLADQVNVSQVRHLRQ